MVPGEANSGLTNEQLLSITSANAQFEQVGDRLYATGGFGDDDVVDPTSRNTFSTLTAFDLPELVDWAKGGTLEQGITVLSGVFTETRGAWTVPVEIDTNGNPQQIDYGNDPENASGEIFAVVLSKAIPAQNPLACCY